MDTAPLISVIVPVYNAGKYLARCIVSVLEQSYRDLELILVDDGSADGSGAVCDQYAAMDNRVRVIHKQNAGVSAARNDGLDAARGEYIAFCDNDDFYAPGMLERLLGMCLDNYCAIAQCRSVRGSGDSLPTPEPQNVTVLTSRELLEAFYSEGTIYIWDKLYRHVVWDGIRFPVGSFMHEDSAVVHRLYGAAGRIAVTREKLYCHFCNPGSVLGSGFSVRWAQDDAFADRLAYAKEEGLTRLYADTAANRFYFEGYLLVMNRKYNKDRESKHAFSREHRMLFRSYYRDAMVAPGVSGRDRLVMFTRRFAPPAFHLYNWLKWRVSRGDKTVRWGEVR